MTEQNDCFCLAASVFRVVGEASRSEGAAYDRD